MYSLLGSPFIAFITLLSFFFTPVQSEPKIGVYTSENEMHSYSDSIPNTEGTTEIAYSTYDTVILGDSLSEEYPLLAEYLEEFNASTVEYAEENFNDMVSYIEEDAMYFSLPYYEEQKARIYRCDENIFSMKNSLYGYAGGAHGYDLIACINVDPVTGKELELSDVLTSDANLARIIDNALRKEYPDEYEYMYNVYETLTEYDTNEFQWTMTNDCLYINFSTYEIASYAAGQVTAPLYFDDHPGLVKSKYTNVSDNSFVRRVNNYEYLYLTDEYGDSFFADLYVYSDYESGIIEELTIKVSDDDEFTFVPTLATEMKSWHARSSSGKNYLITEMYNETYESCSLDIYRIEKDDVWKIYTLTDTEMPEITYDDPNFGERYLKPIYTSWDAVKDLIKE